MEPKVTLLSYTNYPLETIYSVWEASKGEDRLRTPKEIREQVRKEEIEKLFRAIIAQNIPVGEHVDFVFMLEGVSVSFREQMVRHRIGTLPSPERIGVDMVVDKIPDISSSSWWSQSMRIQDMGAFATNRMFRIPDSLENKYVNSNCNLGEECHVISIPARIAYENCMQNIEQVYKLLVSAGVPMEDARELIPLGAQHRISWKINISSLRHIVGERGCWILQLGLWGPIIKGMIGELATKIHPIFREFVTPPCIKGDEFKGCVYMEECRRRLSGEDKLPSCTLHLNYYHDGVSENTPLYDEILQRANEYKRIWGRNPFDGKRLSDKYCK